MKVPLLTPPNPHLPDEGERFAFALESFSPIRQYVIAGVLIVLAALVAVNWVSARAERGIVISRLQDEAISPAEVSTFAIVEQISLRTGASPGANVFADLSWMDRTVLNAVVGQPVARLDIVGQDGIVDYSTDHTQIGRTGVQLPTEQAAINSTARYVEMTPIKGLDGQTEEMDIVVASVPVFQEASAGLMGDPQSVFYVYRDVTSGVATATAASGQFRAIMIIGVMTVMFGALLLVVTRGHVFARAARARLEVMLNREKSLTQQLDMRNEELKAANEAKNRFLSVVTHELNTPLTSIIAFADLLRRNRRGTLSEKDVQQVEAISRSGQQMGLLIRDLLDLSRIEAGTMSLEASDIQVAGVLRDVALSMTPIVRDRSQKLITNLPDDKVEIVADHRRVEQVIINLVSNASKYSPPGSQIWLGAERRWPHLTVTVRDEGIGIGEEDIERLFTPFFRAQNEETRRMPGTGLGLVICRQIAELHGGRLEVESARGQGTSVRFILPLEGAGSLASKAAA